MPSRVLNPKTQKVSVMCRRLFSSWLYLLRFHATFQIKAAFTRNRTHSPPRLGRSWLFNNEPTASLRF